jgi:hypothetical protein
MAEGPKHLAWNRIRFVIYLNIVVLWLINLTYVFKHNRMHEMKDMPVHLLLKTTKVKIRSHLNLRE